MKKTTLFVLGLLFNSFLNAVDGISKTDLSFFEFG